ncbi:hypothetical protein LIER_36219 [Lithospermum erythrorhizon]|uniref:Uncharacterized protein n=1 Tax=Lithospermum erythrorhizon TaxID=34254 RepID=A0AAV3P2M6_LITER
MGLNSDEEDEGSDDIDDEEEDSAQAVLGSDEDEDNGSEDAETLGKDDDRLDVPEYDKEVSKNDAELSEGHSEEHVDTSKHTTEEVAEDDSDDVPLAHKMKGVKQTTPADVPPNTSEGFHPGDLLGRFKQSTDTSGPSSVPKSKDYVGSLICWPI